MKLPKTLLQLAALLLFAAGCLFLVLSLLGGSRWYLAAALSCFLLAQLFRVIQKEEAP